MRVIVYFLPPLTRTNIALKSWGLSLGYALQLGMRHAFMLDDSEIDFELEGPWTFGDPTYPGLKTTRQPPP